MCKLTDEEAKQRREEHDAIFKRAKEFFRKYFEKHARENKHEHVTQKD